MKPRHVSIHLLAGPLTQKESLGCGAVRIGWRAKAGSLLLQSAADESGHQNMDRHLITKVQKRQSNSDEVKHVESRTYSTTSSLLITK